VVGQARQPLAAPDRVWRLRKPLPHAQRMRCPSVESRCGKEMNILHTHTHTHTHTQVTGAELVKLTDEPLAGMGLKKIGHRARLIRLIGDRRLQPEERLKKGKSEPAPAVHLDGTGLTPSCLFTSSQHVCVGAGGCVRLVKRVKAGAVPNGLCWPQGDGVQTPRPHQYALSLALPPSTLLTHPTLAAQQMRTSRPWELMTRAIGS
jgi:hypothetical protein